MADVRRETCRERYMSFNLMTETRGRVVNIEEAFGNLPHRICLTTEEYRLLTKCVGIESLNRTMIFTYKIGFFPLLFFSCFLS